MNEKPKKEPNVGTSPPALPSLAEMFARKPTSGDEMEKALSELDYTTHHQPKARDLVIPLQGFMDNLGRVHRTYEEAAVQSMAFEFCKLITHHDKGFVVAMEWILQNFHKVEVKSFHDLFAFIVQNKIQEFDLQAVFHETKERLKHESKKESNDAETK